MQCVQFIVQTILLSEAWVRISRPDLIHNNICGRIYCQFFFGISLPSVVLRSRTDKFEQKFSLTVLVLSGDVVKALA